MALRRYVLFSSSRADFDLLLTLGEALHIGSDATVSLIVLARPAELSAFSERNGNPTFEKTVIELPQMPDSIDEVFSIHGNLFHEVGSILKKQDTDLVFLLGDRSETLVAAFCASLLGIPIAHLHGGELTEGAIDDNFRHAISKLSHIHFVASAEYENRVRQLGEKFVYDVGAIGSENARNLANQTQNELQSELGIRFGSENYLVTLHPETISGEPSPAKVAEVIESLLGRAGSTVIATGSNSDLGGAQINQVYERYLAHEPRFYFFENLGALKYLSLARQVTAVVGNSSSGLLEIPALGTPTINLGRRQKGRALAPSVISIGFDSAELSEAADLASREDFIQVCRTHAGELTMRSPSMEIARRVEELDLDELVPKIFVDEGREGRN